jgi:hypothetical protein
MKLLIAVLITSLFFNLNPETENHENRRWGQVGHRATGYIAAEHLTEHAAVEVARVLTGDSIAEVTTWMDEVRSDPAFGFMAPWHYCTIPEGMTYEEAGTPEEGDILWAIEKMVTELKSGELSPEQEAINLKVLIHLVGDLHQPLHVGNGTDRGGNDVRVQWFRDNSNLHRVWDSEMIDSRQHTGRELADFSDDQLTDELIAEWQSTSWLDWAYESNALLAEVYDFEGDRLSYEYMYRNFETVELRIVQAGVRLAGLINEIYSK